MKYLVHGHGRTGTHLVSDVLRAVLEFKVHRSDKIFDLDQWRTATDDSVFHTNLISEVCEVLDLGLADQTHLVLTGRWNLFATTVSMFVANHTDEWNAYTDRDFGPIIVDPTEFYHNMCSQVDFYTSVLASQPLDRFCAVTPVVYEDIVASASKEHWLSKIMSLPYAGQGQIWPNLNTRDYQQTITNYTDLSQEFNDRMLINQLWQKNGRDSWYPWMSR